MFILSVPYHRPLVKRYSVVLNMFIVLFCTVTIFKALNLVRYCNNHKCYRTLGDEIMKCMFSYPGEPKLGTNRSRHSAFFLFYYIATIAFVYNQCQNS